MSLRITRKISGLDRIENEPHFPPPAGGDDEVQECRWLPKCCMLKDGQVVLRSKQNETV